MVKCRAKAIKMDKTYEIKPVGCQAVQVIFEQKIEESINKKVMALKEMLSGSPRAFSGVPAGAVCETIPTFAALLIYYDPMLTDYLSMKNMLEGILSSMKKEKQAKGRLIEIPVCYGGTYGEDLAFVARHAGMTEEEVIRLHSSRDYRIYMLGFLPGFPYLGGMDERIFTPRMESPRTKIPAGSVGIGGEQTGIYPVESPGGWRLIGRTPVKLFNPQKNGELPYEAGDWIRFCPIGEEEYEKIRREEEYSKCNAGQKK